MWGGHREFFGSIKDMGIFMGLKKYTGIFGGYCIFHQLKSTIYNTISTIYCWCGNFGYAKNVGIFFGWTNSEFGIFWGIK